MTVDHPIGPSNTEPSVNFSKTSKTRGAEVLRAERRHRVVRMTLEGMNMSAIARELGIALETVRKDLKSCRERYVDDNASEYKAMVGRELLALDDMENECIVRYQRTKSLRWIRMRLDIMDRRIKLLGLDKPKEIEVAFNFEQTKAPSEMTDHELKAEQERLERLLIDVTPHDIEGEEDDDEQATDV